MRYKPEVVLPESVYIEALEACGLDVISVVSDMPVRPWHWDTADDVPEGARIVARRRIRGFPGIGENATIPPPSQWVADTLPELWRKVVLDMGAAERIAALQKMDERVTLLLRKVEKMRGLIGATMNPLPQESAVR